MSTILVIDSAVSGEASVSKALVQEAVAALTEGTQARVIHRPGRTAASAIDTFNVRPPISLPCLAAGAFAHRCDRARQACVRQHIGRRRRVLAWVEHQDLHQTTFLVLSCQACTSSANQAMRWE